MIQEQVANQEMQKKVTNHMLKTGSVESMQVFSLNCGGKMPTADQIKPMFKNFERQMPEIVVLGLQQVVEDSIFGVSDKVQERLKQWKTIVLDVLNQNEDCNYIL